MNFNLLLKEFDTWVDKELSKIRIVKSILK
jgi:hypothetical protein